MSIWAYIVCLYCVLCITMNDILYILESSLVIRKWFLTGIIDNQLPVHSLHTSCTHCAIVHTITPISTLVQSSAFTYVPDREAALCREFMCKDLHNWKSSNVGRVSTVWNLGKNCSTWHSCADFSSRNRIWILPTLHVDCL